MTPHTPHPDLTPHPRPVEAPVAPPPPADYSWDVEGDVLRDLILRAG